jgi:hypothetical protein
MRFGPFIGLGLLLVIVWLVSFVFLHVASVMIHLLLFFAVICFLIHILYKPGTPA